MCCSLERLYRSADEAKIGGVCAGLAHSNNWSVLMVRKAIILLSLVLYVIPAVAYVYLWWRLPRKPTKNVIDAEGMVV